MRITNAITSNNLLLNLQKNMTALDSLQYQAATGNKIQYPSDNPIVAGRALKFRTNLTETNQYLENVSNASSWMQSTASAVSNMKEILFSSENSVRSRLVSASTGSNTISDVKKYITEMKELLSELNGEANATYAGRYIFSGYRTDEPPIFEKNETAKSFLITQTFNPKEISQKEIYVKDPGDPASMPRGENVHSLKLAYEEGITGLSGITYTAKNSKTDADAYQPTDNEVFFIEDTGELIFGKDAYKDAVSSGTEIKLSYTKTGFAQGDLNPVNYFDCEDLNTGKKYVIGEQAIKYELSPKNQMQINSLAKNIITPSLLNDLKDIIHLAENAVLSSENELRDKYYALGYRGTELDEKIKSQLSDENKVYSDIIGGRLTKLIGTMDKHAENLSKENTVIGSRIVRANLIEQRLLDDRINFETLKVNNESVDVDEILIRLSSQISAYSSALQVGAKLVQTSLVNFM